MTDPHPLEPQLVAWLHGELDASERRAVDELLQSSASARARLAVLGATDAALREALDSDQAPRAHAGLADRVRPLFARAVRPLLAVAAVLVTAAVFWARSDHDSLARNELLELRIAPRDGGSVPLFTELAFQLHWRRLDGLFPEWTVMPFPFGTTAEQIAAQFAAGRVITRGKHVPLVISARIRDPSGLVHRARLVAKQEFDVKQEHAVQTVSCIDFEIESTAPRPVLWGKPVPGEWQPDQMWRWSEMPRAKTARWLPELPVEWRLELSVETPPPPRAEIGHGGVPLWLTFAEPLRVTTAVMMTGTVSDWSEANDGMQARMVWSTGARTIDSTPFAIQLRNGSDRTRKYNHAGITQAKIPQPLHFDLVVDGKQWSQRERLELIFSGDDLFDPHPPGQVRTIVVRTDWWLHASRSLGQQPGRHSLQVRFHFQPTSWDDNDKGFWMGELLTPPVTIEVGGKQ